jgi:steroid delta-isomerase
MMSEEHPALAASRNSWSCVQSHDKEGWLDLMADDVCMEDPIGIAPTNPDGKGVRGKAAISEFYDRNIGPSQIMVEAHESFASESPNECAHLMTLTNTMKNGFVTKVRGIFTYRVDDEGKITNLRGHWTMAGMVVEKPS